MDNTPIKMQLAQGEWPVTGRGTRPKPPAPTWHTLATDTYEEFSIHVFERLVRSVPLGSRRVRNDLRIEVSATTLGHYAMTLLARMGPDHGPSFLSSLALRSSGVQYGGVRVVLRSLPDNMVVLASCAPLY